MPRAQELGQSLDAADDLDLECAGDWLFAAVGRLTGPRRRGPEAAFGRHNDP